MKVLQPKPGFQWHRLVWSRPDVARPALCSYCFAGIGEDDVPLMLWAEDGACAQFCDECQQQWWGVVTVPER